jgi:hypothetical protein
MAEEFYTSYVCPGFYPIAARDLDHRCSPSGKHAENLVLAEGASSWSSKKRLETEQGSAHREWPFSGGDLSLHCLGASCVALIVCIDSSEVL